MLTLIFVLELTTNNLLSITFKGYDNNETESKFRKFIIYITLQLQMNTRFAHEIQYMRIIIITTSQMCFTTQTIKAEVLIQHEDRYQKLPKLSV